MIRSLSYALSLSLLAANLVCQQTASVPPLGVIALAAAFVALLSYLLWTGPLASLDGPSREGCATEDRLVRLRPGHWRQAIGRSSLVRP